MKTIDIRINKKLIQSYNPCLGELANFNTYYKDISIKELINSENISYEHKAWLLKKIVSSELLVLWAIDSSFAAYAYSATTTGAAYYAAYYAGNAAYYSAFYAAYAAGNASEAAEASNYAIRASRHVDISVNDAERERLQSLLYLIEGE